MTKTLSLAAAVAALLVSMNVPAAADVPAAQKFTDAVAKAIQDSKTLTQPPADFTTKFDNQLQTALKDAKCVMPNPHAPVHCPQADADSIDAGMNDLQALQDLIAAEKTREGDQASAAADAAAAKNARNMAIGSVTTLALQISAAIPQVNDANSRAAFSKQLSQEIVKDGCNQIGVSYDCNATRQSTENLSAGADTLKTLLAEVKGANAADPRLIGLKSLAAAANQVKAAIPQVVDLNARGGFSQKLSDELTKDGCSTNPQGFDCSMSQLTADKAESETDNLKTLLATVNGANAADPRLIALKGLSQAATQVLTTLPKLQEANAQWQFRLQLGQKVDPDGCTVVSGAYDCSKSNLPAAAVQREIDAVDAILAALNTAISDPRPTLLKNLTNTANQASHGVTAVIDRNAGRDLGQKLSGMMAADGCANAAGVYDCTKATIATGKIDGEIGAVEAIIAAEAQSNASNPATLWPQKLSNLGAQLVNALPSIQNPGARDGFRSRIGSRLENLGCTPNGTYWNCGSVRYPGDSAVAGATADLQSLLAQIQDPSLNIASSQSRLDLANGFAQLTLIVSGIPNPDDVKSLTAKVAAVAAEAGCAANGAGFDCSKTTYNQAQKATPDMAALKSVVQQTAGTDGPLSAHTAQATAAANLQKLGQQLSPQSARDTFNTAFLAVLTKAKCVASASSVDCLRSTMDQLNQLASDLSALQAKTQSQIYSQESRAVDPKASYAQAQDMSKAMSILNNVDKMIDGAAISDSNKQPLYGKVSALRDQLEAQGSGSAPAPSGPTAGQKVQNALGGGLINNLAGNTLGSIADTVAPTKVSGSFGPSPSGLAAVLQTQIQAQIATLLTQTH